MVFSHINGTQTSRNTISTFWIEKGGDISGRMTMPTHVAIIIIIAEPLEKKLPGRRHAQDERFSFVARCNADGWRCSTGQPIRLVVTRAAVQNSMPFADTVNRGYSDAFWRYSV